MSLQLIHMKTRLFTKSGMIIRAVKRIFYLNENKGRSMTSLNMSSLDNLCFLERQWRDIHVVTISLIGIACPNQITSNTVFKFYSHTVSAFTLQKNKP